MAAELSKKSSRPKLYILDEPTYGLHHKDVGELIKALHHLVEAGNSVLVVEHHPLLLAACDWLIELGPGAGPAGGKLIAEGTPEKLARMKTPTSPYLKSILSQGGA